MTTLAMFRLCTLTDEELIKEIDRLTDQMYTDGKVPTRTIPAQPNKNYDLLVGELLLRFAAATSAPQFIPFIHVRTSEETKKTMDKLRFLYYTSSNQLFSTTDGNIMYDCKGEFVAGILYIEGENFVIENGLAVPIEKGK